MRRVYDEPTPDDGFRVLADRLWPRGVTRADLQLDAWWKDLTPSAELRRWYHEDRAGRWPEFRRRYLAELDALPGDVVEEALAAVRGVARPASGPVRGAAGNRVQRITLLSSVRELDRSHLPVLKEWLERRLGG